LELLDVAEALHRQGLKFEFRFVGFTQSRRRSYAPGVSQADQADGSRRDMRAMGAPADGELLH
jgi:hypothetical protein